MTAINDAIFTYYFGPKPLETFDRVVEFQSYYISTPAETEVLLSDDKNVAVIGLCIDSKAEIERLNITWFLSSKRNTIDEFLEACNRLAGNFVVIASIENNIIAINDASGYVQINYHENMNCFASNEKIISQNYALTTSKKSSEIKSRGDLSQPFPNNITMYSEIKALLPTHYLNINKRTPVRYFPQIEMYDKNNSKEEITNFTIERVANITKEYSKVYDLVCPLTAGTDSRLNLAFLKQFNNDIFTYTFYHKRFNNYTADVSIPKKLSKKHNFEHEFLNVLEAPAEYIEYLNTYSGDWHSKYTINLAYTLSDYLTKGSAIVNGDVVDQIGKSLIGNSVPDLLATTSFFNYKTHNVSKESKKEISKWLLEINSDPKTNLSPYDMFALENRLGRWAAQGNMLYALSGVPSLNIYNCRDIIYSWLTISRKDRKNLDIHISIFNKIAPELLELPFNFDNKIINLAKKNWFTFLMGTYLKGVYSKFNK